MDASFGRGLANAFQTLFYIAIVSIVAIPTLLVLLAWSWFSTPDWQAEAIERGFALYCPETGDFAWRGECEVQP